MSKGLYIEIINFLKPEEAVIVEIQSNESWFAMEYKGVKFVMHISGDKSLVKLRKYSDFHYPRINLPLADPDCRMAAIRYMDEVVNE